MLKKILPIVLLLIGTGAGVGAGMALRPTPEPATAKQTEVLEEVEQPEPYGPDNPAPMMEYAKLSNQFVVPIIKEREVAALVVLSLNIEVTEGNKESVFQREPKLRDSFLSVLFDHANMGGFEGAFTEANNIAVLRNALREVAQKDMGKDVVNDVLILEIARQDY
ncbi:flagellar basal body-associated FliL family protein [Sulfitobacter sp. S0837]|uniref:flagellar basal body-associated FliL family protein n=1 Tax=Sulfitobacter maritimus TaxID=2741719 RepID=UPI0015827F98|nr:flagellar basal body-associated FliL family protein [Sulfitobacter maritimus]NUH66779.1 flagellar basal body-associated FliL family protein [Sulfitobacter maritimus]